jgi:hypothetical protein
MKSRASLPVMAVLAVLLRLAFYKLIAIPFGGLTSAMCQYDCGWYARLAVDGYASDSQFADYGSIPNFAFFPLYPLLLRASVAILGMSPFFVGIVLSSALFVGFILLSCAYLQRTRPAPDLWLFLAFIVLFPFGTVFTAVYSESLFAALTVAAMLALVERRILWVAGITALLCATRPTGVLMLPLIVVDRAVHAWEGRHRTDRIALLGETLLPIAIAPLGLSLYMLMQYHLIGDALAFNHVQVLWYRVWVGPFATLSSGMGAWDWGLLLTPKGLPSQTYNATWALLGLAAAGWMAWRRRFAEAWLCAASILLPASTALHSLPRFVATNPFFLYALFDVLSVVRNRVAVAAMFGAAGLLHGLVLVFWFISASSTY